MGSMFSNSRGFYLGNIKSVFPPQGLPMLSD